MPVLSVIRQSRRWTKLRVITICQSRPIFKNGEFRPNLTSGVWYRGLSVDAEMIMSSKEKTLT